MAQFYDRPGAYLQCRNWTVVPDTLRASFVTDGDDGDVVKPYGGTKNRGAAIIVTFVFAYAGPDRERPANGFGIIVVVRGANG